MASSSARSAEPVTGLDTLLLADIAAGPRNGWAFFGRLSRIDVRIPAGAAGDAALKRLQALLPNGVILQPAERRTKQSLDMTAAFTTNLQAMSLLALLVGVFLIFSAVSFIVVQRRRVIGVLRALGATRARVLAMILTEALMLGIVGAGARPACWACSSAASSSRSSRARSTTSTSSSQ